jgi:thiosulfate/3-mercaptopyruvate sulfurtransferase
MSEPALQSPLIAAHELLASLEGGTPPLVLDVRTAEEYSNGHVPGAVHVDLWGVSLIDTSEAPLRAFLWMIEHVLALRGITNERPVVIYSDTSDPRAARVFWFLEYFGHPDVRLLDGGLTAWRAEDLPLTQSAAPPEPSTWTGARDNRRLATWIDVRDRLGEAGVAILDTRSDGEYCGTLVRAARGGAIPGAVHVEWTNNLTPAGTFKSRRELEQMYSGAGVTPDKEVIPYCQGGYRAAHAYVALRVLGYPCVRNYLGSWKEWGDRTDLPIERPSSA